MSNVWVVKWDFARFNFKDLDKEKNNYDTVGINYGHYYDKTLKNKLKKEASSTEIKPDDLVYIYYSNIPGASNQIYLELSGLEFKDNSGNYFVYLYSDEKDIHYEKIVRYIKPARVKWVLDYNDRLRFSKEGLIKNYGWTQENERPGIRRLDHENDKKLIEDLKNNSHFYGKDLTRQMFNVGSCALESF